MTQTLDRYHEEVSPDYYDYGIKHNVFQRYWHTKRFRVVGNALLKIKASAILDVGCHAGRFTYEIAKAFPDALIHGIDLSKESISYAKKSYPTISFSVARAEKIPFEKDRFDLMTCFEVLEHTEDPAAILQEIKRVLKPKGTVLLLVPAENHLFKIIWWLWTHFGAGRVWNHTHIQKFEHYSLDNLLENNGFCVSERKFFLYNMLLLVKAQSTA